MWPSVTCVVCWAWLLAAVSADLEIKLYKKVGDAVVLTPGTASLPSTITSIIWKDGPNLAIQWEGSDIDRFRQFKERGSLNTSSGEMTITGLTHNDSALYTPEINNKLASPTRLFVISPVPIPTVTISCNDERTSCTLTCDGDTTGAVPVSYGWDSSDKVLTGLSKEQHITKEDSLSINELSCVLKNPVSQESSQPIPNPFITIPESPVQVGSLKISTGVTVFISLLAALLMLVLIHRCKAGMWFFQKASMPWEADFWRKNERERIDGAESNGRTAHKEKGQSDEETQMT